MTENTKEGIQQNDAYYSGEENSEDVCSHLFRSIFFLSVLFANTLNITQHEDSREVINAMVTSKFCKR